MSEMNEKNLFEVAVVDDVETAVAWGDLMFGYTQEES